MTRRAWVAVGAALVAVVAIIVLANSGEDGRSNYDASQSEEIADYCAEVEEQQPSITAAREAGEQTGLLQALPSFRALQEKAPGDIADEWDVVVTRLEALQAAFDERGIDPATYDRKAREVDPADRRAIDAAAAELAAPEMEQAMQGVEQQARDVCHTPLAL